MPQFDQTQWQNVLKVLKERHAPICRQWFYDDLSPGQLNNGLLEIHTATPVQQNYLQKRCLEPFTEAAQAVTGQLVAARFVCEPASRPAPGSTPGSTPGSEGDQKNNGAAASGNGEAKPSPLPEPDLADLEAHLPPTPPNTSGNGNGAFVPPTPTPPPTPIQLNPLHTPPGSR
ncbi:MAG: hypothetical protein AAF593_04595, partial [Planctomycetota bacterium]